MLQEGTRERLQRGGGAGRLCCVAGDGGSPACCAGRTPFFSCVRGALLLTQEPWMNHEWFRISFYASDWLIRVTQCWPIESEGFLERFSSSLIKKTRERRELLSPSPSITPPVPCSLPPDVKYLSWIIAGSVSNQLPHYPHLPVLTVMRG